MPRSTPALVRRLNHGLRVWREPLSDLLLAVGIVLTLLAIGYFTPLASVPPFPTINAVTAQPSANYNLVFAIVGPIVVILGGYFVGSFYTARARFEHLMQTRSKAEFVRHIPELEETLWDLTPAYERRYVEKLGEMRIKR